jgi:hypothetical protein
MVPLLSLWLPILLSAILVFVVSSIVHMVLPHHRNDFRRVPDEDAALAALRGLRLPPADYALPYAATPSDMKDPAYTAKVEEGPVALITVMPAGPPNMAKSLAWWFVLTLVVSLFAAYLASRALPPGADFAAVLRFAGATAFAGYALGLWQQSIWYGRPWTTSLKSTLDGLAYALVTGAVMGWLWPGV